MPLRLLNDSVLIEPDAELIAIDDSQTVLDVMKRGIIHLPEKNMIMKLSNKAKVISYGPKCHYKFKENQEIYYDQFKSAPWHEQEGKKYRMIKYHYINAVIE